jgi:hypothetical protein
MKLPYKIESEYYKGKMIYRVNDRVTTKEKYWQASEAIMRHLKSLT